MIRILLADDERGIAEGVGFLLLNATNPLAKEGIEIVGIAEDGEEGIALTKELDPDLIISDVRMPVMDGLEMIERLNEETKQRPIPVKYIMLSGYAEFEYARQAIRLGVRSYICKPVEEEELYEAVRSLCLEIEKEREELQRTAQMARETEKIRKDREELRLNQILEGRIKAEEGTWEKCGFSEATRAVVCTMWELNGVLLEKELRTEVNGAEHAGEAEKTDSAESGKNEERFEKETERENGKRQEERILAQQSVVECVTEAMDGYARIEVVKCSSNCFGVLLSDIHPILQTDLIERITEGKNQLEEMLDMPVSIGIGGTKEKPEQFPESFAEARQALLNKVIQGIGAVISFGELQKRERTAAVLIPEEEIARLEGYLGTGDKNGCRNVVRQIFDRFRQLPDLTLTELKMQSMNLLLSGIRTMPFVQLGLSEYLGRNILSLESLSRFDTLSQMENWLTNVLTGIIDLKEKEQSRKTDVIEQIKEYIGERFDKEISLNEIAAEFYLNPYYLSQLFKKKTGMTYQSYVTSLRIEKAKQLLWEDQYKIYEIAELTGYNDTAYFSKIFEKNTGCRPSEYKKKMQSQE